jgi:hypothetical protein
VSKVALDLFSGLHKEILTMTALKSGGKKELNLSNADMHILWKKSSQDRKKEKIEFIRAARIALEA